MRKVSFLAVLFCLVSCTAVGQVDGRLILDRTDIFCCMPISGVIELRPTEDLTVDSSLEQALGLAYDGYYVKIDGPGGSQEVVNAETAWGGLHVDRGRALVDGVLEAGAVYAIPVYLLKTRERFLFEEPGEYQVSFVYTGLPGAPAFEAVVSVENCDPCGREAFIDVFRDGVVLVRPFDGGAPSYAPGAIDTADVYYDAYAVTMANQSGGFVGRYLFTYDLDAFKGQAWCLTDRTRQEVAKGLNWDSLVSDSRGMWRVVAKKHELLLHGDYNTRVESIDKFGRYVVLPN